MFVIEVRDGAAQVRRGDPPPALVAEFSATARDLDVASGKIYAVRVAQGLALEFSSEIPPHTHQRFRNVFGIHRHRIRSF